jgi:hypothetical protein
MRFGNKVRYRIEDDFILICDLRTLTEAEVPLEFENFLDRLKVGLKSAEITPQESLLASDFEALGFFSEAESASVKVWEKMEFE